MSLKSKGIVIKWPQQQRSKAKFEAILQACPRVLAEHGFEKSTTARIALEAEVSIGTLYDYFSSKEAVLVACLDYELKKVIDSIADKVAAESTSLQEAIRTLVSIGVAFAFDQRDIIKVLFTQFPSTILELDLAQSKARIEAISNEFAKHQHFRAKDNSSRLMVFTITNLFLGFLFRTVAMPEEDFKREAIVDHLTSMLGHYVESEIAI